MGRKFRNGILAVAMGAMVLGGGCFDLGGIWKFYGRGVLTGSGFETGRDLTQTYLLAGITNTQDAVNLVNFEEAVAAERAAREGN